MGTILSFEKKADKLEQNNIITGKELKQKLNTDKFYKILKDDKIHHNFEYKLGKNTDIFPFNPSGKCEKGGLCFTTYNNLCRCINYYTYYKLTEYVNIKTTVATIEIDDNENIYLDSDKMYKCQSFTITNIGPVTYDIYKQSVSYDCLMLKYVPNHINTKELCELAVKRDGIALKYVPKHLKTNELCELAVDNTEYAFQHITYEYMTPELSDLAIKTHGCFIRYVPEKYITLEYCKLAIKSCYESLKFLPAKYLTEELYISSVTTYGGALQYVPEKYKTSELCQIAVENNRYALEYVPEELITKELAYIAFYTC